MPKYQPSREAIITILAEENPKRPGSRARRRFGLYRNGMAVQEFLNAGDTLGDIYYDISHAYVAVLDYPYSGALSRLIDRP